MNCLACKHRRPLSGDTHSACHHPENEKMLENPMAQLFAIFASVGRVEPVVDNGAAAKIGITLNEHGVRSGWCNWPMNYDPIWVQSCNGFTSKEHEDGR